MQLVRSLRRAAIALEVRRGHGSSSCWSVEAHLSSTGDDIGPIEAALCCFSCRHASVSLSTAAQRSLPWPATVGVAVLPFLRSVGKSHRCATGKSELAVRVARPQRHHKLPTSPSLQRSDLFLCLWIDRGYPICAYVFRSTRNTNPQQSAPR